MLVANVTQYIQFVGNISLSIAKKIKSGNRAFANAAPLIWNVLPPQLHTIKYPNSFMNKLKKITYFPNIIVKRNFITSTVPVSIPEVEQLLHNFF